MQRKTNRLLSPNRLSASDAARLLEPIGFQDPQLALDRLRSQCRDAPRREAMARCLPMLLSALEDSAAPDTSVMHLERLLQTVPDSLRLLEFLADHPRAVEILIKLFVNSRYLTEILLRNPDYLDRLTRYGRVAEFKSREEFLHDALSAAAPCSTFAEKMDALRRCQQWELLRLAACDSFGLFDLKSVTLQLSLMADALVQAALKSVADELQVDLDGFVVLAFGKLGGEELNYSSDIDLIFLSDDHAERFWELGQKLIRAIMDTTAEGFLYRVDMRLRPWGQSGPLVCTADSYRTYLSRNAAHWEKQALLKARPVAGNLELGARILESIEPLLFETSTVDLRRSVASMKGRIESGLRQHGRNYGEIKSGPGSIRDIEFLTQFLQLLHGRTTPQVRSRNTLDGLVRLADFECILPGEYRQLTTAYVFLRRIEHALQLLHHQQAHTLPTSEREQTYLARRLDFPDARAFLDAYERHCAEVRAIFRLYLDDASGPSVSAPVSDPAGDPVHVRRMDAAYRETFAPEETARHGRLLSELTDDRPAATHVRGGDSDMLELTVVSYDQPGNLAIICGLLFVHGFDIIRGHAFTSQPLTLDRNHAGPAAAAGSSVAIARFMLKPPADGSSSRLWEEYQTELADLIGLARSGELRKAQGLLVRRVGAALRESVGPLRSLAPIEVRIDNEQSDRCTVLQVGAEDTPGFLYELAGSLTLLGFSVERVVLNTQDRRAIDTFFILGPDGRKVIDVDMQNRLRAAVVLVKHFTHLLPVSPGPRRALEHFSDFLTQLFERSDWNERLATIDRQEVLEPLARLLGVSDFLWSEYLRPQHDNLFPVLYDVDGRESRRSRATLDSDLRDLLEQSADFRDARRRLNEFKDREMFRVDMRHIAGQLPEFRQFADELSDVAEAVVSHAVELCLQEVMRRHADDYPVSTAECPYAVLALGKAGGRELGFASDVELMFVYDDTWCSDETTARQAGDCFSNVVKLLVHTIHARRKGIFELDLRLRPYGNAGPLAVSASSFLSYFDIDGPAWPFERQALVKLRPISGHPPLGDQILAARDRIVYGGLSFDVTAMRAMRERQIQQHVQAGTWNAKLSDGGLVDCEYLVQGLQINHGHSCPEVRSPNTLTAIQSLQAAGHLTAVDSQALQEAYLFLRRLIDALRMVRGDARDLAVPENGSEEFEFLARRLSYGNRPEALSQDIDRVARQVTELLKLLDRGPQP